MLYCENSDSPKTKVNILKAYKLRKICDKVTKGERNPFHGE